MPEDYVIYTFDMRSHIYLSQQDDWCNCSDGVVAPVLRFRRHQLALQAAVHWMEEDLCQHPRYVIHPQKCFLRDRDEVVLEACMM